MVVAVAASFRQHTQASTTWEDPSQRSLLRHLVGRIVTPFRNSADERTRLNAAAAAATAGASAGKQSSSKEQQQQKKEDSTGERDLSQDVAGNWRAMRDWCDAVAVRDRILAARRLSPQERAERE